MADPANFKFAIEGVDDSAAAFTAVEKRAAKSADRLGDGARKMQARFDKVTGPARLISPEMDRAYQGMARLGKLTGSMREAFVATRRAPSSGGASAALSPAEKRFAARGSQGMRTAVGAIEKSALDAADKAAGRAAKRHGLGRFTGDEAASAAAEHADARAAAGGRAIWAENLERGAFQDAKERHETGAARQLGFGDLGAVRKTLSGLGEAAGGAEAEVATMGEGLAATAAEFAGLAAAGPLVLAAVGATIAAAKVVSSFARVGQEVSRTADLIGANADTLQRFRGAAELNGISPHAADSAFGNLGQILHNARFGIGGSETARSVRFLQLAGVDYQKDDEQSALLKITDYIGKNPRGYDIFSKKKFPEGTGTSELLPAMLRGRPALEADLSAVDATGVVQDQDQRQKGIQARRSFTLFDQAKRGAGARLTLGPVADAAIAGSDGARATMQVLGQVGGKVLDTEGYALEHPAAAFRNVVAGAGAALHSVEPAAREAAGSLSHAARVVAGSIQELVAKTARAHGLNESGALAIVQRESRFNPNAKAGTSSASGLYQFTKATAARVGLRWDDRFDPAQNAEAGSRLERMNVDYMERRLHRPVSSADAYLAHFYGPGAAVRFEQARDRDPSGDAAAQFPKEAASNKPVFYDHGRHRTVDEVFHRLTDDRGSYSLAGDANATSGKVEVAVTVDDKRATAVARATGTGIVLNKQTAMVPH